MKNGYEVKTHPDDIPETHCDDCKGKDTPACDLCIFYPANMDFIEKRLEIYSIQGKI